MTVASDLARREAKLSEQAAANMLPEASATAGESIFNPDNFNPPWTAQWERAVRQSIILEARGTSPLEDIFSKFLEDAADCTSLQRLRASPSLPADSILPIISASMAPCMHL